ncbi:MAG TPA: DMT family transporter [Verrucomicrobiae bacterium]|nr:DMT family transporter [Verrucomicrobiae bacterium]
MRPARSEAGSRLQIAASAVLFSTGGAAIKGIGLGGFAIAALRSAIAVPALLFLLPAARRRPRPAVLALGVFYAATLVFFVLGTKLTTSAAVIFLQSTAPIYVVLLSPRLLGEPVRKSDVAFLLPLAAGLLLFLVAGAPVQATAPRPALGNLLGALSGLTWALTLLGLRRMGRDGSDDAPSAVVVGNAFACLATLPWALPLGFVAGRDLLVLVYLGVIQIGLAYALLTTGLSRVRALDASLLLFLEPVLNPVWAFLVHGERPRGAVIAAGLLILGSTFCKTIFDLRRGSAGRLEDAQAPRAAN